MVTLQTCKIHPDSMSNLMTTDITNIYFPKEIYLYYSCYKKKLYKTLFFPLFHLWSSTFIFFEKKHMFLVRKFSHFFTLVFDAKWSKHALLVSTFQFQIDQFFLLWKFQTSNTPFWTRVLNKLQFTLSFHLWGVAFICFLKTY